MYDYVDHGPVRIPTSFQTNTPNNKEVKLRWGWGWAIRPPLGQRSAKNSPAWMGLSGNLLTYSVEII